MTAKKHFPKDLLNAIRDGQVISLRAGTQNHRFIGIWVVVVENRVFVRSWGLKPRSWHRVILEEERGTIQMAGYEVPVRAIQTKSERLKDAVSRAYLDKYSAPASYKYARDLGSDRSRATTTELVPF
jgi:hypothetical protein